MEKGARDGVKVVGELKKRGFMHAVSRGHSRARRGHRPSLHCPQSVAAYAAYAAEGHTQCNLVRVTPLHKYQTSLPDQMPRMSRISTANSSVRSHIPSPVPQPRKDEIFSNITRNLPLPW